MLVLRKRGKQGAATSSSKFGPCLRFPRNRLTLSLARYRDSRHHDANGNGVSGIGYVHVHLLIVTSQDQA